MNRRNAIRALLLGAPAAAVGMVAVPAVAAPLFRTGEAGPELFVRGERVVLSAPTITVHNGSVALAREVTAEVRRYASEALEQYSARVS